MAAIRRVCRSPSSLIITRSHLLLIQTFNNLFASSENDAPAVVKRAGSEIVHPSKLPKFAAAKDAVRKPLATKSTNASSSSQASIPSKSSFTSATVAAASNAGFKVLPSIPEKTASAMDTKEDDVLHSDFFEGEGEIEDVDKFDEDPQLASEYTKEIYQYMRSLEV